MSGGIQEHSINILLIAFKGVFESFENHTMEQTDGRTSLLELLIAGKIIMNYVHVTIVHYDWKHSKAHKIP